MERYFVGLDVSKAETAVCVRDDRGEVVTSFKKPTDPDVLARALSNYLAHIVCVVLETGRMANWLYDELSQRGLPMVCIDARQAHAVLSQMHNSEAE
ncbi:MAG: transposase [Paracoccaceae bacterium]